MANVTYLLGAGGSFHALPVVEQFEKEIGRVLSEIYQRLNQDTAANYQEIQTTIDDLEFLKAGCQQYSSVDTFAKTFFLRKMPDDYRRVKQSIILFLELYHEFYKKVDKRYDAFLSSIIEIETLNIPDKIRIISWNYDYELERAYNKYLMGMQPMDGAYNKLVVQHKGISGTASLLPSMIKLNGTVGYTNGTQIRLGYDAFVNDEPSFKEEASDPNARLKWILSSHAKLKMEHDNSWQPLISFAWEEQARTEVVSHAEAIMMETNSLVVIGYSFPYFNRPIDKILLGMGVIKRMWPTIYVQDPSANDVIESVQGLVNIHFQSGIKIQPISSLKQFYMPYELD